MGPGRHIVKERGGKRKLPGRHLGKKNFEAEGKGGEDEGIVTKVKR